MSTIADLRKPVTAEQLAEFSELTRDYTDNIPYCPWQPNPGPQTMFLLDFGKEALYGGAGGGGKSIALLMAASQFLFVPGYAALLLRKSYADLQKPLALMQIAEEWWRGKPGIRFDNEEHAYYFDCPGGGTSQIVFGAMDNENDRFKYQGGAYLFVGYDEVTQFKERDYLYLFSRMRKVSEGPLSRVPLRMRCTSNPGGTGHEWVYKRFVVPWQNWRKGTGRKPTRSFHPALISDNPKLDEESYVESLDELDPITRAQMLRGDWDIRPEGRMFKKEWFKAIRRDEIPGYCTWVRFWDLASTDPSPGADPDYTVGMLVGRDRSGNHYIADMRRFRMEPAQAELRMMATGYFDTTHVLQAVEEEPGASGKFTTHYLRNNVFRGLPFRGVKAAGKGKGTTMINSTKKTPRAKIVAAGPVASQASVGQVFYVHDGSWDHDEFFNEITMFPDAMHDDIADALSGAFLALSTMHSSAGLSFSDNDMFEVDNQWVPDPQVEMNIKDIEGPDDVSGTRLARVRELTEGEVRREVFSAWDV